MPTTQIPDNVVDTVKTIIKEFLQGNYRRILLWQHIMENPGEHTFADADREAITEHIQAERTRLAAQEPPLEDDLIMDEDIENSLIVLGILQLSGGFCGQPDYVEARRYFMRVVEDCAEKPIIRMAECMLGYMHEHGLGVTRDVNQSIEYYHSASRKNNYYAYYLLGKCHESGRGSSISFPRAGKSYQFALKLGFEPARDAIKSLVASYREETQGLLDSIATLTLEERLTLLDRIWVDLLAGEAFSEASLANLREHCRDTILERLTDHDAQSHKLNVELFIVQHTAEHPLNVILGDACPKPKEPLQVIFPEESGVRRHKDEIIRLTARQRQGLLHGIRHSTTLTDLTWEHDNSSPDELRELLHAIGDNKALVRLRFTYSGGVGSGLYRAAQEGLVSSQYMLKQKWSRGYVRCFADEIGRNNVLEHLDLSRNNLDALCIQYIVQAMQQNTHLTHLDLYQSGVNAVTISSLSQGLTSNFTLTSLRTSRNSPTRQLQPYLERNLSIQGCVALLRAFEKGMPIEQQVLSDALTTLTEIEVDLFSKNICLLQLEHLLRAIDCICRRDFKGAYSHLKKMSVRHPLLETVKAKALVLVKAKVAKTADTGPRDPEAEEEVPNEEDEADTGPHDPEAEEGEPDEDDEAEDEDVKAPAGGTAAGSQTQGLRLFDTNKRGRAPQPVDVVPDDGSDQKEKPASNKRVRVR